MAYHIIRKIGNQKDITIINKRIMEPFGIFGVFIGLISIFLGLGWFICCIILFFKVWGMCNDVKQILQILAQRRNEG